MSASRCSAAKQVTIRRLQIDTDQHGLPALKDFVGGSVANRRKILSVIDRASLFDSGSDDIVNGSHAQRTAEMIAEQFADAAKGTSASQEQSEYQPSQPDFRHGEIEQNFLIVVGRCKSILQALVLPDLFVDK